MAHLTANRIASVSKAPLLLVCMPEEHRGWTDQYAEEGYHVTHIVCVKGRPENIENARNLIEEQFQDGTAYGLITYGLTSDGFKDLAQLLHSQRKACVHYCPQITEAFPLLEGFSAETDTACTPTVIHLAASQEALHASLLVAAEAEERKYPTAVSSFQRVEVYTYPFVSADPPFSLTMGAPASLVAGEASSVDPHVRSATGLSYTRSLQLLRRQLGPHFDLEKLWEQHTYLEFAERNAPKTMTTMVKVPYVNHIPTMTGGIGYDDLARFYKYHFTTEKVTPPDTTLIPISRTVGADRLIDEMIFKCSHTTEIDWMLPGIPPTGKPIEIPLVGVVAFRGDKLTFEHIYWDQASVLVQIGVLDQSKYPVAGVETARKAMDPFGYPSNSLMAKWNESTGQSVD